MGMEVTRRMLNCDGRVGKEERKTIIEDFMVKLRNSEYNERERKRILERGLERYGRMKKEVNEGKRRSLYRTKEERRKQKRERSKKKGAQEENI